MTESAPLQFRERRPQPRGLHAQGATAFGFAFIGLLALVTVSVWVRGWSWPVALPFLAATLVAGGNAIAILAGRNPPWWLRWTPLPVFVATFWLLPRVL